MVEGEVWLLQISTSPGNGRILLRSPVSQLGTYSWDNGVCGQGQPASFHRSTGTAVEGCH